MPLKPEEFKVDGPCQEASAMSVNMKIDCGRPAVALIWHDRDQRAYRMCDGCSDHNIRNRGAILLAAAPINDIDAPKAVGPDSEVAALKHLLWQTGVWFDLYEKRHDRLRTDGDLLTPHLKRRVKETGERMEGR